MGEKGGRRMNERKRREKVNRKERERIRKEEGMWEKGGREMDGNGKAGEKG